MNRHRAFGELDMRKNPSNARVHGAANVVDGCSRRDVATGCRPKNFPAAATARRRSTARSNAWEESLIKFLTAIAVAVSAGAAVAMPTAARADGAATFGEVCSSCHGTAGEGSAELKAPAIAGLDQVYLKRQVAHFLDGTRPVQDNPAAAGMVDLMRSLGSRELDDAIAVAAALPVPDLASERPAAAMRMRGLYSGCASCHGGKGQGEAALSAPRLQRQHGWYLKQQLLAFRSGQRGTAPSDNFGKQMRAIAQTIPSDGDVDAIVAYIQSLRP